MEQVMLKLGEFESYQDEDVIHILICDYDIYDELYGDVIVAYDDIEQAFAISTDGQCFKVIVREYDSFDGDELDVDMTQDGISQISKLLNDNNLTDYIDDIVKHLNNLL